MVGRIPDAARRRLVAGRHRQRRSSGTSPQGPGRLHALGRGDVVAATSCAKLAVLLCMPGGSTDGVPQPVLPSPVTCRPSSIQPISYRVGSTTSRVMYHSQCCVKISGHTELGA